MAPTATAVTSRSMQPRGPRLPLGVHEPNPEELVGYCQRFNVLKTQTRADIHFRLTTSADGTETYHLNGMAIVEMKNQTTGKMIEYNNNGPGTFTRYPDGRFSIDLHGPNLFWFEPGQLVSVQGVPRISYTTGHLEFSADANGRLTAYSLAGTQTDVCAALA